MNSKRSQEIDEIFQSALDLPSEQRSAFLDQACASDHGLRAEIESLISSYEKAGNFIEQPAMEVDAAVVAGPLMHKRVEESVGHYRIVELLGAGGQANSGNAQCENGGEATDTHVYIPSSGETETADRFALA